MVKGNTTGIKKYVLEKLENLYEIKIEKDKIIDEEVARIIAEISSEINREINMSIDRRGNIFEISIGDDNTAPIPNIEIYDKKLSGVRVVHTHPNGNSKLSNVDLSALIKLKLDCICALGVQDGIIMGVNIAFCDIKDGNIACETTQIMKLNDAISYPLIDKINSVESKIRENIVIDNEHERSVLVGVNDKEELEELKELAHACDIEVVGVFTQSRQKSNKSYYIGSGKAQELAIYRQVKQANLIIFDEELNGIQVRNLENITGTKVIDRTVLILEIFARRAKTREAKIQVELARLKYQSGRLLGYGVEMSRLGGGAYSKGSGETKLELDRRRIKSDIQNLNKELEKIKKVRNLQREKRENSGITKIALVGYTNVGKSSLRNLLSKEYSQESNKDDVLAKDMLFATLDTTTRAIVLPNKTVASITDTVGFVRKLPHELVEAFKSTLEEVIFADEVIHVVDVSNAECISQIMAVENVLESLDAKDKPTILALNKIDRAEEDVIQTVYEKYSQFPIVEISVKDNINIELLLDKVIEILPQKMKVVEYLIPYTDTKSASILHNETNIISENYEESGVKIKTTVNEILYNKLRKYMLKKLQ